MYERDGFEVFYGLSNGEGDVVSPVKAKPDGYDKFYGIRSQDRQAIGTGKAGNSVVAEGPQSSVCRPVAIRGPLSQEAEADLREVPTYSVATPAPPYVPPVISNVPSGVNVYSLATPLPPPPEGLSMRIALC